MTLKGKQLKNNTILQSHLSLATPVSDGDAATKNYVDVQNNNYIISQPTAWTGASLTLDLSSNKLIRKTVNTGVSTLTIALSLPSDANAVSREIVLEIDNSTNSSAISTIVFDSNFTWRWGVGIMPSGLAANTIAYLTVYNVSSTIVRANWEVIA